MMSLWDALRMNMMISYQELVRTFPKPSGQIITCMKIKFRLFIPPQLIIKVGFKFI